jgi:hypothetical protein
MWRRNNRRFALALALLLAACAGPEIDRTAPTFDEQSYSQALADCRGGSLATFMWGGLTAAVVGSAWGAAEGAQWGAVHGGVDEAALIGSIVGGVLGMGVGAVDALAHHDAVLDHCMRHKGYAETTSEHGFGLRSGSGCCRSEIIRRAGVAP